MKLKAIVDFVVHGQMCGKLVAYESVIEFKKSGLSHAHVVLSLNQHSKHELLNTANMDRLISADNW